MAQIEETSFRRPGKITLFPVPDVVGVLLSKHYSVCAEMAIIPFYLNVFIS